MDAIVNQEAVPVVVDLDGTLIAGDLFWESLFQMLLRKPWLILFVPIWALSGKSRLKHEVAAHYDLDSAGLLYRKSVINTLLSARQQGRPIVLATGSPKKYAVDIARHLAIFDKVLSSSRSINLTSHRKAQELERIYGKGGFDYIGNSADDIAIFEIARQAIVVAPDRKARRWQFSRDAELIETARPSWQTYLKMLRVHQWMKNTLIFVPLILDQKLGRSDLVIASIIAFWSFSLAASAIYIVNDIFDMPNDRRHSRKRSRPIASGAIPVPAALITAGMLLALSIFAASFLLPEFWVVLGGYLVVTTAYSMALKRMLLIDAFTLAGLYSMRIIAGAVAISAAPSFWLLAFSIFFFLSLALAKRHVELQQSVTPPGHKIAGRGYRTEDATMLAMTGMASGCTAALVLALYVNSPEVFANYYHAWLIWPLVPIILYIITRIWILAGRGELHEDPVVFIITDWRSQLMIAIGTALVLAAALPW